MKLNRSKKDARRYPYYFYKNGKKCLVPQQKNFGSYCRNHGCSVTAVSIAIQLLGKHQSDGTIWNPSEVAEYAQKHVAGYNGSKLSIYGCKTAINSIYGSKKAIWHSNNGKRNKEITANIKNRLRAGDIILFEQKNPIHTVVFAGISENGSKVYVISNGKGYWSRLAYQIGTKALHGTSLQSNQKNWWNGANHGAGYVVVRF